jgi:hypothetical protein
MGHEPTQYPKPVSQRGSYALRALRGAVGTDVRQPDLGSPPIVSAVTGFGTGQGAYVRNNGAAADQSQGLVVIQCGINPGASGTVVLVFPNVPPSMFVAGDWGSFTQGLVTKTLTITWTATRTLLPNERLLLAYQWSQST